MSEKEEKIKVSTTYEEYKKLKESQEMLKSVLGELKRLKEQDVPTKLEIKLEVNFFREQNVHGKKEIKKPLTFTGTEDEAFDRISKHLWTDLQAMQLLSSEIQLLNKDLQKYRNVPAFLLKLFSR